MSDSPNRIALPIAAMESSACHESLGAEKITGFDSRFNIKVTSYRWGKHDPDGVCVKAVLDGIIRRGILLDDSTDEVKKICFESKKAKTKALERTTIEIYKDQEKGKINEWG